jgi:DNA replication protein DnaC
MSTDVARLQTNLKRLSLHTIAAIFEHEAQKAAKIKQSYGGLLSRLVEENPAAKLDRSVNARIARARFPVLKTLEQFQFEFQPSIPAALVWELAVLGFLELTEGLILCGPPGSGKVIC